RRGREKGSQGANVFANGAAQEFAQGVFVASAHGGVHRIGNLPHRVGGDGLVSHRNRLLLRRFRVGRIGGGRASSSRAGILATGDIGSGAIGRGRGCNSRRRRSHQQVTN